MDNVNIAAALRLASFGISVFPCAPDKKPRLGVLWKSASTTDIRTIEAWWRRWPDSIPAFEPGVQQLPMVVIDCDRHGGPDGVAALIDLATEGGDDPRDWPTVETPSTGRHVFFANPDGLTNARGTLPPGIDVRGAGGYVVAEGATLPDGRTYAAPAGMSGLFDALESGALPMLPQWLASMLTAQKHVDPPRPMPVAPQSNGDARGRAIAEKAMAEDIAALAAATGNRNDGVNGLAYRLGRMIAAGWIDRTTVESHLEQACAANGLWRDDGPRQCRATIKSGLDNGAQAGPPALAEREKTHIVINLPVTHDVPDVVEHDDDDVDEPDAPPIDDALTHVPGILGEVIDFITATARRPNRRLALAAALPLCGMLLGRRMAGPTGLGTHLYVIATYPTGGGKQHQMDVIDRLLTAINLTRHIGPSQFMSLSAIAKHLYDSPLSLCAQDEFGAVLAKIGHPRASGHEQAISQVLREAFGRHFSTYRTPAYATSPSREVRCPSLSLFGTSTAGELYEALKGKDIANGFLNRFLIIDGGSRVAATEPSLQTRNPPKRLLDGLSGLYAMGAPSRGNMAGGICKNTAPDPSPMTIPWASSDAADFYTKMVKNAESRMDDEDGGSFFVRVADIALRCATIRACGRSHIPVLALDDLEWAAALSWQSADRLKSDAERYMIDPLGAAEFERTIMRKLAGAHHGGMTLRKLHRSMQRHFRNANDLKQALESLARSGMVAMEGQDVSGGRRITVRRI